MSLNPDEQYHRLPSLFYYDKKTPEELTRVFYSMVQAVLAHPRLIRPSVNQFTLRPLGFIGLGRNKRRTMLPPSNFISSPSLITTLQTTVIAALHIFPHIVTEDTFDFQLFPSTELMHRIDTHPSKLNNPKLQLSLKICFYVLDTFISREQLNEAQKKSKSKPVDMDTIYKNLLLQVLIHYKPMTSLLDMRNDFLAMVKVRVPKLQM